MFKLGQNTSNKLLSGIFVAVLFCAVALINSVTVRSKSLFSSGSCEIRDWNALRRGLDGGRIPVNEGIASVDREGGFLNAGRGIPLFLGLLGRPGPRKWVRKAIGDSGTLEFVADSWFMAASK
jgi:hypothetical protein